MQKQTSKYILSMLIATMLLISMFPLVVPVQAAIVIDTPAYDAVVHVDDEVWINGTGAAAGGWVNVYWDVADDAYRLARKRADGAGIFNITVVIPEAPASDPGIPVRHYIIVEDVSVRVMLEPMIKLTPDAGIPGDPITLTAKGFASEEEIVKISMYNGTWSMDLTTSPGVPFDIDVNGTSSCTFDVPSDDAGDAIVYGSYTINASDTDDNLATADFEIGAAITLAPVEGPSGTVVDIDGRGFVESAGNPIQIMIRMGSNKYTCWHVDEIESTSSGTFSGEFVIPTLDPGDYLVNASDGTIVSGDVEFEVTGRSDITLEPKSGIPGDTIDIEGVNFTAISAVEVNLTFTGSGGRLVTLAKKFSTNSTGGFKDTFAVPDHPDLPIGYTYPVLAKDEYDLTAAETFRVVRTRAFVDYKGTEEGPTGGLVDVWVEGLTDSAKYNVTIDGELMVDGPGALDLAEGTLNVDGQFQTTDKWISLYVPTIPVGTATIIVMDEAEVTASVSFEVTETTEFILSPPNGPATYNITIEANYYTAEDGVAMEVWVYNDTWEDELEDLTPIKRGAATVSLVTNATGSFLGWFEVPDLNLGDYKINATDANGLGVWELDFSVVAVTVEVSTVRTEYAQGEDITFKVTSTFPSEGSIELMDADDFNHTIPVVKGLTTDTPPGSYQQIGDWYFAYPKTATSTDAPLGTWYWTADIGGTIRKGSLSVVESTTGVVLIQRINELEEDLAQLSDAVDALGSSVGGVSTDIGAVEGYVDELESDLDAVSAAVSGISAAASAAETAATDAKAAAEAANTTASGISMAVYGSMALSLIAALAAIAAVLTLQRKVAG